LCIVPVGVKVLGVILIIPSCLLVYIVVSTFSETVPAILIVVTLVIGVIYAHALKLTAKNFIDPKQSSINLA